MANAPVETKTVETRSVTLRVPVDLFDAIEAYRWDNRIDKRADAFLEVLKAGIGSADTAPVDGK